MTLKNVSCLLSLVVCGQALLKVTVSYIIIRYVELRF